MRVKMEREKCPIHGFAWWIIEKKERKKMLDMCD